ncbi:MAG: hypothetical protein K0R63_870 [Rickettsiales bacterium]|jgi:hypothetical protein|nr:hypothetical protein [Rickettsiales bacterium]
MFRRFFSKGEAHQNVTILKVAAPVRTSIDIFNVALDKWEKDKDPLAPVWLNYGTPEAAQEGLKELRREHQLSDIQTLASVVIVSGEDGRKLISAIRRLQSNYHLEHLAYQSVKRHLKKSKKKNGLIAVEYPSESDAIAGKRTLAHRYGMYDILRQDHTLLFTVQNAKLLLASHGS